MVGKQPPEAASPATIQPVQCRLENKNAYQHCVTLLEFAFYHVSI